MSFSLSNDWEHILRNITEDHLFTCRPMWSLDLLGASSWPLWLAATRGQQLPNKKEMETIITVWFSASVMLFVSFFRIVITTLDFLICYRKAVVQMFSGVAQLTGTKHLLSLYDQVAHDSWDEAANSMPSGLRLREACCAQASFNNYVNFLKTLK